jgi:hypothetical protein
MLTGDMLPCACGGKEAQDGAYAMPGTTLNQRASKKEQDWEYGPFYQREMSNDHGQ